MSLSILSVSSMAALLTTVGLSASSLLPDQTVGLKRQTSTQTIYSVTEVIGGGRAGSPRILPHRGNRRSRRSSQQSTLRLNSDHLNLPHTLTVGTTGQELTAVVKVNGRTIHTLVNQSETLNLSHYLSEGQHTIEIVGTYSPASATAEISLTGPGTQISQQTSGRGIIHNTWQISVQ